MGYSSPKTKLSPSILSTTPQHAGLYSRHSVVMPMVKRKRPPVKSLPPKYQNIFASMDELIQVHECNSIVDNQLKEDRKQVYNHEFARMNALIDDNIQNQFSILQPVQEHKLNVIICKNT